MTEAPFWPERYFDELGRLLIAEPTPEHIREWVDAASDRAAEEIAATQLDDVPRQFSEEAGERAAFEARLRGRWGRGLDLFDLNVICSRDLGAEINRMHRPRAAHTQSHKFDALTRLHGRSIQVSTEISTLMRAGLASGAMARWRTLYESWVVFSLLAVNDDELSRRYLAHDAVEAMKGQDDYEETWQTLGFEPPEVSPDEREEIRSRLAQEFGKPFLKDYGWAAPLFGDHPPKFRELRAEVDLDHWCGHYRMASHSTHANPRGIFFSIQDGGQADVIAVGQSNAGLIEPAQCSLIALANITIELLMYEMEEVIPDDDVLDQANALVHQKATLKLTDAAIDEFAETTRTQENEEARLQQVIEAALAALAEDELLTSSQIAERLDASLSEVEEALDAATARGLLHADRRYFSNSDPENW